MDALRFDAALSAYERAYELSHDPALLYNEGRAYQARGENPRALERLEQFAREAPLELKARVPGLATLLADLRLHVAAVDLHCDVDGARVLLGGREVGVTPLAAPAKIDAGRFPLEVLAEGYYPYSKRVDLQGAP